jgi:hypothetical protein
LPSGEKKGSRGRGPRDIFTTATLEHRYPDVLSARREVDEAESSLQKELVNIRKIVQKPKLEYKTLNTGGAGTCIEYL